MPAKSHVILPDSVTFTSLHLSSLKVCFRKFVVPSQPFEEAARGYEIFEKREEECRKVILVPGATSAQAAQKQATGVINPMPGGVV